MYSNTFYGGFYQTIYLVHVILRWLIDLLMKKFKHMMGLILFVMVFHQMSCYMSCHVMVFHLMSCYMLCHFTCPTSIGAPMTTWIGVLWGTIPQEYWKIPIWKKISSCCEKTSGFLGFHELSRNRQSIMNIEKEPLPK